MFQSPPDPVGTAPGFTNMEPVIRDWKDLKKKPGSGEQTQTKIVGFFAYEEEGIGS